MTCRCSQYILAPVYWGPITFKLERSCSSVKIHSMYKYFLSELRPISKTHEYMHRQYARKGTTEALIRSNSALWKQDLGWLCRTLKISLLLVGWMYGVSCSLGPIQHSIAGACWFRPASAEDNVVCMLMWWVDDWDEQRERVCVCVCVCVHVCEWVGGVGGFTWLLMRFQVKDSKEEVGGGREFWWCQGDPVILQYWISYLVVPVTDNAGILNLWSSI
jgi:hypothetical protein